VIDRASDHMGVSARTGNSHIRCDLGQVSFIVATSNIVNVEIMLAFI
jgi:hypothetical protein